ncbi:hypothetical protein Tco_0492428 [Tanacetum coccineum]
MKDKMVYKRNNVVRALMNVHIFVGTFSIMTDFAVLEDMDAYRDEGMGDVIFGEPFLREVGIKTKRFEGRITIYNGDLDNLTSNVLISLDSWTSGLLMYRLPLSGLRYRSLTKNEGKTSSKVEPYTEPLKLQTFADIQAFLLSEDELEKESDEDEVLAVGDDMDEDPQVDAEVRTPLPNQTQLEPSHVQESASNASNPDLKKFDNTLPLTERQLIKYLRNMSRASIEEYYEENIAHRDQTDQLVAASMSSLEKRSSSISDLYKGLNVITELLKDINNVVKDDPATNKKIDEAIKTFSKISTQTTEILSLVKTFDFSTLQSTMQDLQAHALKQEEASISWTKSSTNMAWNLGSRMTAVEISQTALKHEVSSLRKDTLKIKSMMAKIYQAFKGQPSFGLSGSVTPTLALTHIPANVKGENVTNTATEEPLSHTKGETGDTIMAQPKRIIIIYLIIIVINHFKRVCHNFHIIIFLVLCMFLHRISHYLSLLNLFRLLH